jgi:hypothetical protein
MTAEEYMMENMQGANYQEIESALIGFATLKCKELLEIVAEKTETKTVGFPGLNIKTCAVDRDSILNAVDLDSFIS